MHLNISKMSQIMVFAVLIIALTVFSLKPTTPEDKMAKLQGELDVANKEIRRVMAEANVAKKEAEVAKNEAKVAKNEAKVAKNEAKVAKKAYIDLLVQNMDESLIQKFDMNFLAEENFNITYLMNKSDF